MRMNKERLWTGIFALFATVILMFVFFRPAFGWHFQLSGAGVCNERGQFEVTWKVDNSSENQALHILTSNRAVVPTGDVPAGSISTFKELTTETVTLTLSGNWNGDESVQEKSATVEFDKTCHPPVCEFNDQLPADDENCKKPSVVIPPTVHELPNTSLIE